MEKKFDDLVLPNKKDTIITRVIGQLVMVITLGTGFFFCYGALLDRRDYYNRKALYGYIKKNGAPKPAKSGPGSIFYFGKVEITITEAKWHGFIGNDCVFCSFCSDIFDRRRYEAIDTILRAAT